MQSCFIRLFRRTAQYQSKHQIRFLIVVQYTYTGIALFNTFHSCTVFDLNPSRPVREVFPPPAHRPIQLYSRQEESCLLPGNIRPVIKFLCEATLVECSPVRQVRQVGQRNRLNIKYQYHYPWRTCKYTRLTSPARYACLPRITSYASSLGRSIAKSSDTFSSLGCSPRRLEVKSSELHFGPEGDHTHGLNTLSATMGATKEVKLNTSIEAACSNKASA